MPKIETVNYSSVSILSDFGCTENDGSLINLIIDQEYTWDADMLCLIDVDDLAEEVSHSPEVSLDEKARIVNAIKKAKSVGVQRFSIG